MLVLAVLLLAAGGCDATSGPGPGTISAAAMTRRVAADALTRGWAHVAISSTLSGAHGGIEESFSDIAGPGRGRQVVTVGPLSGSVILMGHTAYVRGSAGALFGIFDLPATAVRRLAGRWVAITSRDEEYASVAAGVTLVSVMTAATPRAPISLRRTTLDGQRVVELTGGLPAAAGLGSGHLTLYATDAATPLPVEAVGEGADGREVEFFGELGIRGDVEAPAHAASLPAPKPSGDQTVLAAAGQAR